MKHKQISTMTFSLVLMASVTQAHAVVLANNVALQNATATASQTSFGADETIDSSFLLSNNGWATNSNAETIVWETTINQGDGSTDAYNFRLYQGIFGNAVEANQLLRNFRLSYTTSDRSTFADGLINGGDVTTRWAVIDSFTSLTTDIPQITFSTSASGDISTTRSGNVFVTQASSFYYDIAANITANGITGFKLEVLSPPGWSSNGNFVLREVEVSTADAVPEPSSSLLGIVGAGMLLLRRKRG